jgi:hemolysin D
VTKLRSLFKKLPHEEFQPLLAEIYENPANPIGPLILILVCALTIIGIVWASLAKTDVIVSSPGIVIPKGESKIVQPLEGGTIREILVAEGERVVAGQPLIEIDPAFAESDLKIKENGLSTLRSELWRLGIITGIQKGLSSAANKSAEDSLIQGNLLAFSQADYALRKEAKQKEEMRVHEQLDATTAELSFASTLLEGAQNRRDRLEEVKDIVAREQIDKANDEIVQFKARVNQAQSLLRSIDLQILQIHAEIAALDKVYRLDAWRELSQKHREAQSLQEEKDAAIVRRSLQVLRSPVEGYIGKIYMHTIGGVVTPAQPIISVVPIHAPLIAKATVLNKDIGLLRQGLAAVVKVETFNFQKYGTIGGSIIHVSNESVKDEKIGMVYEVYLELDSTELHYKGEKVVLSPGMNLMIDFKIGKRRVVEFFLSPLFKAMDEGIKVK